MICFEKSVSNLRLFFIIQKGNALKLGKKGDFVSFFVVCAHKKRRFRTRKSNNAPIRMKKYTRFRRERVTFVSG